MFAYLFFNLAPTLYPQPDGPQAARDGVQEAEPRRAVPTGEERPEVVGEPRVGAGADRVEEREELRELRGRRQRPRPEPTQQHIAGPLQNSSLK